MPIAMPQDHRNDARLSTLMSLKCPLHFFVVAILRRKKIRTREQQNDICLFQLIDN